MMQRTSFELGNFKSAPATLALVIVTVLLAVALTLVASNLTTAGGIPSYTVIVDPDDETDAIDLATFTYGDAKTELLGIPDGQHDKAAISG
ncbi:MAG: hypothetical protein IIB22_09910 [Chloroflexi bacterium]|nr:hypothetical protein [Chloroflexota bacterium]